MSDRWFDGTYYKREITVNYMDCNTDKKVFLHYMLGIFSEIAGDECQAKGQTHDFFVNHGKIFLLTRMSIRFHKTPKWDDTVIFTTWFRTTEGKFFLRDCEMRAPDGELFASASSTWALIDPVEHKVLDPDEYPGSRSCGFKQKADSPECKKIISESPLPVIGYRPVYYTDLDCNHHVNNSVYSKIATDFLPPEYRSRDLFDFVINFNKETKLGETLEIRGAETEDGYIIQGSCDGNQHFACEFTFKNNK
ncbi:MAG: hypothetical protein GXY01_06175 [Clostridiales bacterium]|jgi:medium-chain acyl-[acyl-carrier-protein] hydrolase|nr:hypothetical protein [Clostridiales bacterium]